MPKPIHQAKFRAACAVRTEPYWGPKLGKGRYVGYRKISAEEGSWVGRIRVETDAGELVQRYETFKDVGDYDAAVAAAMQWFPTVEAAKPTESTTVTTVAAACRAYVTAIEQDKNNPRPDTARDALRRFERTVFDAPLGRMKLAKVRAEHLTEWRDNLDIGKASKNRTATALKAALYKAVADRHAPPTLVTELRAVKVIKKAGARRRLYLDRRQRKALYKAASGAVRDLIAAAALTGARAGELTSATVAAFDPKLGRITLAGKTGERTVSLSPAAITLFKARAKGREPHEFLLTRDDGQQWKHSDWDELVRDAATKAKLPPGCCLYTLRHSYITAAIDAGATALDVAHAVGTSLTMISAHYGQQSQDARDRLARLNIL